MIIQTTVDVDVDVDIDIDEFYEDYMSKDEKEKILSYLIQDYGIDYKNFQKFFNELDYNEKVNFIKNFVYNLKYNDTENLLSILEKEVK